jgi:hypothetical protein
MVIQDEDFGMRLPCMCHIPGHALDIRAERDDRGNLIALWVTLWHDPVTLRDRIAAVFNALFKRRNCWAEVILSPEVSQGFIAYIASLQRGSNRVTTTTASTAQIFNGEAMK